VKQNEVYTAQVETWLTEATVSYTGAITTLETLEAAE
jgi:hypothetical protein